MVRRLLVAAIAALVGCSARLPTAGAAACSDDSSRLWRAGEVVGPIGDALAVRWAPGAATDSILLPSGPLAEAARHLRRPRRALIAYTEDRGVKTLAALGVRVSRWERAGVLLGVAWIGMLLAVLLTAGRVRQLALGQDNRYSKSKCQMLLWFGVLIGSYGAMVALRWWAGGARLAGGVGIPDHLLLLSGLSALSFVGAKAITQGKENRAEARLREQPATAPSLARKTPASRPSFPGDLVNDDRGRVDLGDVQMIVVTLLAVIVYGVRVFVCLGQVELGCRTSLPDVDTTILGAFGIGQGAYLAKKAASRPGEG